MFNEAERAFRNALEFHEAAVRCAEKIPHPERENQYLKVQMPEIVCTAFAAELYLKALILRRGDSAKYEHRLLDLYQQKLEESEQEAIARHYTERRNAPKQRMLAELAAVSSTFVKWRYSHEFLGFIDLAALMTFAEAAYLTIRDIMPAWAADSFLEDRILNRDLIVAFVAHVGADPSEFNRAIQKSLAAISIQSGKPQTHVIKCEYNNLSLTAPTLNLDCEAATLNVYVRRCSDAQDGGTGEALK